MQQVNEWKTVRNHYLTQNLKLIKVNNRRTEFVRLTFQALALRQSKVIHPFK